MTPQSLRVRDEFGFVNNLVAFLIKLSWYGRIFMSHPNLPPQKTKLLSMGIQERGPSTSDVAGKGQGPGEAGERRMARIAAIGTGSVFVAFCAVRSFGGQPELFEGGEIDLSAPYPGAYCDDGGDDDEKGGHYWQCPILDKGLRPLLAKDTATTTGTRHWSSKRSTHYSTLFNRIHVISTVAHLCENAWLSRDQTPRK
ncbi:hypothetical protein BGW80DRAFT_1442365 [Lactifluus volemus]|nr:hypothetical protein BGW80DRAFT_1442365 [Lactifluus volemus]